MSNLSKLYRAVITVEHLIPAQPGYFVIEKTEQGLQQIPIVGWGFNSSVFPMTINDMVSGDPSILCPDGQVITLHHSWPNLSSWLMAGITPSAT